MLLETAENRGVRRTGVKVVPTTRLSACPGFGESLHGFIIDRIGVLLREEPE